MQHNRREILKKVAYVAPAIILTLPAFPAFAARGSSKPARKAQYWGLPIEKKEQGDK